MVWRRALARGGKRLTVIGRYNDAKKLLAVAEKPVRELGRHIHLSFHHKGWQIRLAPSPPEVRRGALSSNKGSSQSYLGRQNDHDVGGGCYHHPTRSLSQCRLHRRRRPRNDSCLLAGHTPTRTGKKLMNLNYGSHER